MQHHPDFPFTGLEAAALKEFLARRTVPVFGTVNGRDAFVATGSLLAARGQHFLVTAAHIFDTIPRESLAVPDGRTNASIWTLGKATVVTAESVGEHDLDAAAIWLRDASTIERLRANWTFLQPSDITWPETPARSYLIAGFPGEYCSVAEEQTTSGQVLFVTQKVSIPSSATEPVDPRIDLFFEFNPKTFDLDTGAIADPPRLQGVSGASVWCVMSEPISSSVIWSLESLIKVVAIQSAAAHKQYIRAKTWRIIADMIKQLKP